MTRIAIVCDFRFRMAIHAPFHRHLRQGFRWRGFTLTDVPMAGLALDLPQEDMTSVGIEDVIGLPIKAFPGDFPPLFGKLPDFFFFRALGDGVLVALQAGCDFRQTRKHLLFGIGMAGNAFYSLVQVFLVIECNRLFCP